MMKRRPILINLSTKPRPDNSILIKNFIITVSLIVVLAGGMGFFYNNALQEFKNQKDIHIELNTNQRAYSELQEEVERQKLLEDKYFAKANHVAEKTKESYPLSSAFNIIETAIPPNTQIINLKIDHNKILLRGLASNYTEVAQTLAILRSNTVLTDAGIISKQNMVDSGKVLFEIETVWEAVSICN